MVALDEIHRVSPCTQGTDLALQHAPPAHVEQLEPGGGSGRQRELYEETLPVCRVWPRPFEHKRHRSSTLHRGRSIGRADPHTPATLCQEPPHERVIDVVYNDR